jgi:hypothetical protein
MRVKIHTATLWIDTVLPGTWVITNYVQPRKERVGCSFLRSVGINKRVRRARTQKAVIQITDINQFSFPSLSVLSPVSATNIHMTPVKYDVKGK